MEDVNFIFKLIENMGPIDAALLIFFFFVLSGAIRFLIYFLKRKTKNDTIEAIEKVLKTQFDKLDKEMTLINEDQDIIMNTIENITQALVFINNKMRNVISEQDSKEIIRLALSKCLLLKFIRSAMDYSCRFKELPSQTTDLQDQMRLELRNGWADLIFKISTFKFSTNIAETMNEKFLKEQICNGNGIVSKIIDITFNETLSMKEKYNRIMNFHSLFIEEVMNFVEEEYKKMGII